MHKNNFQNTESHSIANWQIIAMMLVTVVVWAFAFPFIKIGLRELSFINLTIMRFFIASIGFIAILVIRSKKLSKLQKQDIPSIFVLGFCGVIIYHFGLNYGEQYISAGTASLIITTIPIFIVILSYFFLDERLTKRKTSGIFAALIGVVIISIWGTEDNSIEIIYMFGALTVLISAVMGAVYTVAGKKLLNRYTPLSLTIYTMLLGSFGLAPFVLVNNSFLREVANMSIYTWFAIVFLGLFSTVLGYIIWYVALEKREASELSIYLYMIPVVSTIISYFLFDDKITPLFILGGLLVITGLVMVNKK
ncbi:MAG: EamA/RhaT family transporter [Thermoplasmata archaeon]|nr:MAG: EamA/RhaT family transporter [Thermoplasmata archaeon]RLF53431.1 MAG: EamA/RhaT family transporter [Thermoplasmata archaeon]